MPGTQSPNAASSAFPLLLLCVPMLVFFYLGLRERLHTGTFILVFSGFCLVLFAAAIDFTERLPELNGIPVFGANDPRRGIYQGFLAFMGMMGLVLGAWWEIRLARRSEAEDARRRRLREAILASMGDAVIVVDRGNRILFLNPAAEKLLGKSSADIVGDDLRKHLPAKEMGKSGVRVILGIRQDKPAKDDPSQGEGRPQQEESDDLVMSMNVTPLQSDDGELSGTVRSLHDVTELAKVNQLKSEYVSTVSHEMRTPLTSIKAYLDLLLDGEAGELNEMQLEALHVMEGSTNRIIDMINNFLDLARIEEGIISFNKKPFVFDSAVSEAIEPLRNQFNEKDIRLKLNLPGRPLWVSGDRARILQVLTNLLSNACKYTPNGGEVDLSVMADGQKVRVDVTDTGIGIAEEDQPKIFTKFFRASNNELAGPVTGSGLGLAISKSIVEMHGGGIWFHSNPGSGTTFSFTLPRAGVSETRA